MRHWHKHGKTVRDCPDAAFLYTLQSGDPNKLAIETDITTVTDPSETLILRSVVRQHVKLLLDRFT